MKKQMTLATAILLTGGLALAGGGNKPTFETMDTNEDRSISKDEYYGSIADMGVYSDFDYDSNGLIDETEFDESTFDGDFDTWDANNDSYLDSDELYDGVFDNYDANNDDIWTQDEWDDANESGLFDV